MKHLLLTLSLAFSVFTVQAQLANALLKNQQEKGPITDYASPADLYTTAAKSSPATTINDGDRFVSFRCNIDPKAAKKIKSPIFQFALVIHGVENTEDDGHQLLTMEGETDWAAAAKTGYMDFDIPVYNPNDGSDWLLHGIYGLSYPVGTYKLEVVLVGHTFLRPVMVSNSKVNIALNGINGPWGNENFKNWATNVQKREPNLISDDQLWVSLAQYHNTKYPDVELVRLTIHSETYKDLGTNRELDVRMGVKYKDGRCSYGSVLARQTISGGSRQVSAFVPQDLSACPCQQLEKARNVR